MKTILYFNNRYIDTLSELKNLFTCKITEDLRRELLAAFQDGVIDRWLSEGDEECHGILNELAAVDKSDLNQSIERKLISVFSANGSGSSFAAHVVKFKDHCQIQEISYCKIDKDGNLTGTVEPLTTSGIRFNKYEFVGFRLSAAIKITNPDNEIIPIQMEISDSTGIAHNDRRSLSLNTRKNDLVSMTFDVELGTLDQNTSKILLKVDDNDVFWTTSLSRRSSFVTLHLGDMHIPLSLVKRRGERADFYIMRYQATDGFRYNSFPIRGISKREVVKIIDELNRKYNVGFRLPSVEEWQYAAKGGPYNDTYNYSGSDNVEDVAWHYQNTNIIQKVGLKKANRLGLFDMSGNVWEMTSDIDGGHMVTCGGSFYSSEKICRVNSLSGILESGRYDCGFRLVCDIASIESLPEGVVEFENDDDYVDMDTPDRKGRFIDMGGPVLWSVEDYTKPQELEYQAARHYAEERGENSRLPSFEEFEELFANTICEIRNGYYQLKSKINGNILKIPYQEALYWTGTKDPTVQSDRYEWHVYASLRDQICYDHQKGISSSTGRTDVGTMNVISVIEKK